MAQENIDDSIYVNKGFANREDYLKYLAQNYGAPPTVVTELSNLFGPNEDFDGLVSALEDYVDTHQYRYSIL